MKSHRQGNDLNVRWKLRTSPNLVLEDKSISLYLKDPYHQRKVTDYSIDNNTLSWTFRGADQKHCGIHTLTLCINEGKEGMITIDACNFINLVSCSCQSGGTDDSGVKTETVDIESTVEFIGGSVAGAVLYTEQKLTEEQKSQARMNIGVDDAIESAIAELPEPESVVFKAEYGVTTIEAVTEAYNQGKVIHCDYGGRCYILTSFTGGSAWFSALNTTTSYLITLNSASVWGKASYSMENTGNKTDTINADVASYLYPSAKAVYNFVQSSKEVFEATYRETTYEEIVAAYNKGQIVKCQYGDSVYRLNRVLANGAYFVSTYASYIFQIVCTNSNTWYSERIDNTHTLKVLENGNVELFVRGLTVELMPATPSGDPMHYLYVSAGAEYNATDEDIEKQGMYGDTIIHKARHWYLNELGDITNDQMRAIFVHWQKIRVSSCYFAAPIRTNLPFVTNISNATSDNRDLLGSLCQQGLFETFDMRVKNMNYEARSEWGNLFIYCYYLKKLLGEIKAPVGQITQHCFYWIEEMRLKELKTNWSMRESKNFSNASILFAINNEAATSAITITLHADAYARAMADSEITAALEAHPNVSLASA